MSVYHLENYSDRVKLAASYISAGRESTRSFDTCFEMYDGDAVCVALVRRVQKNPETELARNIWRYLSKDSAEACALKYQHVANLSRLAAELRRKAQLENQKWAPQETQLELL